MITAVARADRLVQRLRARAERLAGLRAAAALRERRSGRIDWHSASALWPDFTADSTRI